MYNKTTEIQIKQTHKKMYHGTLEMYNGTLEMYNGTLEMYNGTFSYVKTYSFFCISVFSLYGYALMQ